MKVFYQQLRNNSEVNKHRSPHHARDCFKKKIDKKYMLFNAYIRDISICHTVIKKVIRGLVNLLALS